MGYTHYYYLKQREIPQEIFTAMMEDCKRACTVSEIPMAGWDGSGEPEFTSEQLAFNGVEKCGHAKRNLGITWPSPEAKGGMSAAAKPTGSWFAGASLDTRTCGGDCSHEPFRIARKSTGHVTEKGEVFSCCKTAYKPYDILVTACMIIAKHHLGDGIRLSSDGDERDWEDGRKLCQFALGYGEDFRLEREAD